MRIISAYGEMIEYKLIVWLENRNFNYCRAIVAHLIGGEEVGLGEYQDGRDRQILAEIYQGIDDQLSLYEMPIGYTDHTYRKDHLQQN